MSIDKREKTYNNLVGQGNESSVMASPHLEKSKPFDHNKQNIPKKQFVYSNEFITLCLPKKTDAFSICEIFVCSLSLTLSYGLGCGKMYKIDVTYKINVTNSPHCG